MTADGAPERPKERARRVGPAGRGAPTEGTGPIEGTGPVGGTGPVAAWARPPLGVALGVPTAVVGLGFVLGAGAVLLAVSARPRARVATAAAVRRGALRLAAIEHRRLSAFAPGDRPPLEPVRARGARVLGYLAARSLPGALGALAVGLLGVGAVLASIVLSSAVDGRMAPPDLLVQAGIGTVLLLVLLQGFHSIDAVDRRLARALLSPSPRELLERRVSELTESRAGVVAAVDAERRRIERDLHDGLQQRLVALGMLLGRARRGGDPDRAAALVGQAHEAAQQALDDLREVAWQVYPSALEHAGLEKVLTRVAQRSSVPVEITCALSVRPARRVETALYFVACEAMTNAAKHAGATLITVRVERRDEVVGIRVHDDGTGGADPAGAGLSGLERRVTALDGRFEVVSPPGGPTVLTAELPCG
ncbi:sensor histidine kinase [Nocardiopsis aegyptia]|uniref:sensor histidine kinase n=1 Tax=Nocardiopsis aegyptia TaxID=220378 RepID=UPI00366E363E